MQTNLHFSLYLINQCKRALKIYHRMGNNDSDFCLISPYEQGRVQQGFSAVPGEHENQGRKECLTNCLV
jgi:hypothetical protein